MNEIWKPVVGYEEVYEVSNLGRVKSLPRRTTKGGIMSPFESKIGKSWVGLRVELSINGKRKKHSVHRLVAEAFIPNPDDKPQVNHIDNNPSNNHVSNLEWVTCQENVDHARKQGRLLENTGKAVVQYDLQGNIISTFNTATRAEEKTSCHRSDISMCCKGKIKTSKGFIWKYKDDPLTSEELAQRITKKPYPKNRKSRLK